jgi:hypothetical protein
MLTYQKANALLRHQVKKLPPATECSCEVCVRLCHGHTCIGTPDEIEKLMDMGYSKLFYREYMWIPNSNDAGVAVLRPDVVHDNWSYPCAFLKDGKCIIHAIKPLEGRLVNHDTCGKGMYEDFRRALLRTWQTPRGEKLVRRWYKEITK